MSRVKDLTGMVFGRLTTIKDVGSNKYKRHEWLCKCECGNEKVIEGCSLTSGNTKSCGCLSKELNDNVLERRRENVPIICGIYKITNPKGEVYIGGSRTIYRRWLRHREARKKIKVHLSIKEFGWREHKFEVVHQLPLDVTDEILLQYEQLYIDRYRDCGFSMLNVKDAGSSAKFSEESKKRMSEAHIGQTPWNKGLKGGNKMANKYKIYNL